MGLQKVLARDWKFEINKGGGWIEIKGVTSFAWGGSKTAGDTTDFNSGGWEQHLVARRGRSLTLEGHYLEVPKQDGEHIARIKVLSEATSSGNITVTLNESGVEPVVVGVLEDDTPRDVAGKIATAINAETDWSALSVADVVTVKHVSGDPFTVSFDDTGLTGVSVDSGVSGDRDEGQEAVDELCTAMGADSLGQFRVTSPAGTAWSFYGSVEPADVGGGEADTTSWGATITVSGKVT